MYVSFEDIKNYVSKTNAASENPGVFIEYMVRCYEPDDVTIDDDGDIIIRI